MIVILLIKKNSVGKVIKCSIDQNKHAKLVMKVTMIFLGISGLVGILFLPLLIKVLKGPRRMIVVLQQLSILCFLALVIIRLTITENFDTVKAIQHATSKNGTKTAIMTTAMMENFVEFFQNFCYYEFYFLALMHSWDMYEMICNPLKYAEFCKMSQLIRVILSGTGICALLAFTHIVELIITFIIFTNYHFLDQIIQKTRDAIDGMKIFDIIKTTVIKIVYSVVITKISLTTKHRLDQSLKMNTINENNPKWVYKKFFYFSLLPTFINALFLIHEIPNATFTLFSHTCTSHLVRGDVRLCLTSSVVTMGILTYLLSFLILFPKIRKTIIHYVLEVTVRRRQLEKP